MDYNSEMFLPSFTEVVESVRQEAARLKGEGVEILIAVGHYGYAEDMAMAQQGWRTLPTAYLCGRSCVNLAT